MAILRENGDTLKAGKIIITARKFTKPKISKSRTSTHKLQQCVAEGTVIAVISKPMRAIKKKK